MIDGYGEGSGKRRVLKSNGKRCFSPLRIFDLDDTKQYLLEIKQASWINDSYSLDPATSYSYV